MADNRKVDRLLREFHAAACALGEALIEQLQAAGPDVVAPVNKALEYGALPQLVLKVHPDNPAIVYELVFPGGEVRALFTFPAKRPRAH